MALSERVAVLRDGRIRQCGPPAELYARPADTFVARFVGTPPMNLLPGAALGADARVRARLRGRDPAAVLVGLRPHDLEASPADGAGLALEVALVEPAGPETWVVGSVGGHRVQARLARAAPAPAPGSAARLAFGAEALHLFDAATGVRLAGNA